MGREGGGRRRSAVEPGDPGRGGGIRGGWTLPELLVGTVVAGLLLAGAVGLLHRTAAVTRMLVDREEVLETFRTVWTVLHQEVGVGMAGRDWELEPGSPAALRLRAFRGIALPCGWAPGTREGPVRWIGHRAPDPDRDSVLVLTSTGRWWAGTLEAVGAVGGGGTSAPDPDTPAPLGPDGCSSLPAGREARWRLDQAPPDVLLFRYFERGRYSLEDGAFRYRRGGEGRQPLTPERVGAGSWMEVAEGGALAIHLELEPGGGVEWRIEGSGGGTLAPPPEEGGG